MKPKYLPLFFQSIKNFTISENYFNSLFTPFVSADAKANELVQKLNLDNLPAPYKERLRDLGVSEKDDPADFANSASYGEYLERMGKLFGQLERVLRPRRYAVVIVRDAYQDGTYRFVASDLAARAAGHGLVPKGDLIWYQAGARLRPYGYPSAFVPNIVHQHVLVLRKG